MVLSTYKTFGGMHINNKSERLSDLPKGKPAREWGSQDPDPDQSLNSECFFPPCHAASQSHATSHRELEFLVERGKFMSYFTSH